MRPTHHPPPPGEDAELDAPAAYRLDAARRVGQPRGNAVLAHRGTLKYAQWGMSMKDQQVNFDEQQPDRHRRGADAFQWLIPPAL